MHRRVLIPFGAFLLCVLAYYLVAVRRDSVAASKPEAAPEPVPEEVSPSQLAEEERQTREDLENLAILDAKLRSRREADAKMYEARSSLQRDRYATWSFVIQTNLQAFETLRQQADASPAQKAQCTICDGKGAMDYCVLCEKDGKCPTCKGKAKGQNGEICPTCVGTGICYLCAGSGKMPCLFCDDGTISHTVSLPPRMLPTKCDPVPAFDTHVPDSELASEDATEEKNAAEASTAVVSPKSHNPNAFVQTLVLLVVGGLVIGIIVHRLGKRWNLWNPDTAISSDRSRAASVEDPSLAVFFTELKESLNTPPQNWFSEALDSTDGAQSCATTDPVEALITSATGRIEDLRELIFEIGRASDAATRKKALLQFSEQVCSIRENSRIPALHLVWLTASALEGLMKQLSREATEVTASVRQTIAGAVDLLEALCAGGLNPNLATEPPIRLLAVDDDAVSRLAISFALKKAFNQPDLAPDGPAALGLIGHQRYDVIFLDVDMPGMDGFELCTRIRQTALNRTTPVVFVTRHSDFNSRAKSTLSGGQDLIGKPFLAFEITVKALTLALRGRLKSGPVESASEAALDRLAPAVTSETATATVTQPVSVVVPPGGDRCATTPEQKSPESDGSTPPAQSNGHSAPALLKVSGDNSPDAFTLRAPVYLEQLRNHLFVAQHAVNPDDLKEALGELLLGTRPLNLDAENTGMRAVCKLSSALESLLRKLLEHPKYCSPSTLNAVAAALELLDDLCRTRLNPDLGHPSLRLLVVDDDPVALRAISGSLQLAFGRPEKADCGEAAVALAAEKSFDLIFLDVLMPGIDGFTTCSKIHETKMNRTTPVVFVTSRDDMESRSCAAVAGGCEFIPKPVLPSEITLSALTLVLRARMNGDATSVVEPADSIEGSTVLAARA